MYHWQWKFIINALKIHSIKLPFQLKIVWHIILSILISDVPSNYNRTVTVDSLLRMKKEVTQYQRFVISRYLFTPYHRASMIEVSSFETLVIKYPGYYILQLRIWKRAGFIRSLVLLGLIQSFLHKITDKRGKCLILNVRSTNQLQ